MTQVIEKLGPFVLWYAITLVVLALLAGVWALIRYRRTKTAISALLTILQPFEKRRPAHSVGRGLPLPLLDEIRTRIQGFPGHVRRKNALLGWWKRVNDSLVRYGPKDKELWYLGRPVETILDAEAVINPTFPQRFIRALPGLITSAGLLGTFIAILLALWDLRVEQNQIIGIAELIQNLAGKFVTSIAAIFAAILLSLAEQAWFTSLRSAHRQVIASIDHLFPQLDAVIILRDVQEDGRQRTVSLANISSEVVDRFQSVFTTELLPAFAQNVRGELAPALEGVRDSMDKVREVLGGIQQEKQESVVGEFKNLATGLENTLRTTLEQMGRDFRASLSGSTSNEFDRAAEALNTSAEVLRGLNSSFGQMRESLDAVVVEARRATAEQLATGAERANSLNQLVEQLLVRLNESATNSAQQVQHLMMQSVEGLNRQVENLSRQMTEAVASATSQATDATQGVVKTAQDLSRKSREESEALALRLQQTLERMETVGDTLGAAQLSVRQVIAESAVTLKSFERAGAELRASSEALAGTASTAKATQESLRSIVGRVTESVAQFGIVAERQQATLERQMNALGEVERVFDGLDGHLGAVLGEITERLQQHNQAIQQNFEAILSRVNVEIPKVSMALSTATEELSANVEDLSDVIQRFRGNGGKAQE
jgi:hypothetical protein